MAMNIITKDKKVIKWLGIPKCYQQIETNNETDMTRKSLLQQIEEEEVSNLTLYIYNLTKPKLFLLL
jgi:hypothetical protein